MKLVRFATLYFKPNPLQWNHWEFDDDGIIVEPYIAHETKNPDFLRLIVKATVNLNERPSITKENVLIIPEASRKLAEKAIENMANYIAVSEMCKRRIKSPVPCVAFIPEDAKTLDWLNKTKGFSVKQKSQNKFQFSRAKELTKNDLNDRIDGISLLAEALSNDHATGRLHELIRVFERAFKLSPHRLVEPLFQFLNQQGYSYEEIHNWIFNLRDKSIHADKREDYVLESDVRPIIDRIEQAAYDVLLNKAKWRDPSPQRRNISIIKAGTKNENKLFTKTFDKLTLDLRILDPFGAYPLDFTAGLDNFPKEMWIKTVDSIDELTAYVDGGNINIDLRKLKSDQN